MSDTLADWTDQVPMNGVWWMWHEMLVPVVTPVKVRTDEGITWVLEPGRPPVNSDAFTGAMWYRRTLISPVAPPSLHPKNRQFVVAAVSKNTNNLGLHGVIILDRSGQGYEVGLNQLNVRPEGHAFTLRVRDNQTPYEVACDIAAHLSGEIPRALDRLAPQAVIDEAFQNVADA